MILINRFTHHFIRQNFCGLSSGMCFSEGSPYWEGSRSSRSLISLGFSTKY